MNHTTAKGIIKGALNDMEEGNVIAIENWYRRTYGEDCPRTRGTLRHALSSLKATGEIKATNAAGFYRLPDTPSDAVAAIRDAILSEGSVAAAEMLRVFANMMIFTVDAGGTYIEAEGPDAAWKYGGFNKEHVVGTKYYEKLKGTSVEPIISHWTNALRGIRATIPSDWSGPGGPIRQVTHAFPLVVEGAIVGAQCLVAFLDPFPDA